MKIRPGFVSNSSSSSFVCKICGRQESGWDLCKCDCGFAQLGCYHDVCECHIIDNVPVEDLIAEIKRIYHEYRELSDEDKEFLKNIESAKDPDEFHEMFWEYEGTKEYLKIECPICNLVDISGDLMTSYILIKYGMKRKEIEEEVRNKFKTVDKLVAFIKENKNED